MIEQARSASDLQRAGLETEIASLQSELTSARRQLDTQQAAIEIHSLEEKHVHARGALSHYRQSVKEQAKAAAKSSERELEMRLLLVAAQSENEQLRRLQAIEAEPVELVRRTKRDR